MIGVGQIGVGAMARTRAKAFLGCPDVRIVSGYSRSEENLASYRKLTGAHGTHDWRELVEDARIAAICVGTPTHTHADFVLHALQAGKHVLVECPAALKIEELARMEQAAECARVVLYIGSNYRFDRAAQAVAHAATHLGAIRLVQGDSSWQPAPASWFWARTLSGGVFACVHLYQMTLFHCLGRALWVEATFCGVPEYGVATVRYESGAMGVATGGFHLHGSNSFEMVGSEGRLCQESDGRFVLRRGGATEQIAIVPVDPTVEDNACFLRCIRGEDDWRIHFARERAVLGLALAAQQSAESGTRVDIQPKGPCFESEAPISRNS